MKFIRRSILILFLLMGIGLLIRLAVSYTVVRIDVHKKTPIANYVVLNPFKEKALYSKVSNALSSINIDDSLYYSSEKDANFIQDHIFSNCVMDKSKFTIQDAWESSGELFVLINYFPVRTPYENCLFGELNYIIVLKDDKIVRLTDEMKGWSLLERK